jgi:AdoMet-dependent heme synthase
VKLKDVRILFLGLTNKCNGKCITCWHSNRFPFVNHEISPIVYKKVKDELFNNIKILNLVGGGETMLYSRIGEVLEDIKKYKFKTIITSNFASIKDKERRLLSEADIDFVVSLDGSTAKLQEFIRPNCNYETVIDNIKYFISKGRKVVIQTTVSNHNFYDIENIILLAEKLGVSGVRFHSVEYLRQLDHPYRF